MRRRPFLAALLPSGAGFAVSSEARAQTQAQAQVPAHASGTATALASADAVAYPPPLGVSHRALRFPADHAAHPDTHIEWWYVTGWLRLAKPAPAIDASAGSTAAGPPDFGFQVTFFRARTDLAADSASRFAARQLVFAHVALTDLAAGRRGGGGLMHDQRVAREGFGLAQTPGIEGEQTVRLHDWRLVRASSREASGPTRLHVDVRGERFALDLALSGTQSVLLQGDAGFSQKGPDARQASHYYSEPQLAVRGRVERAGAPAREVVGRAWLDHEWSNELLPKEAVGWDWIGFNLNDGGALTAFRLRRADGSSLWAGGSLRDAAGVLRVFGAAEVAFTPLREWKSPRTQATYPVEWTLATPAGKLRVAALQDDQELDSRDSTGSVYWEGVSELRADDGRVLGWGYLELTGYAGRLRL